MDKFRAMNRLTQTLLEELDVGHILEQSLEVVFQWFECDRALLLSLDGDTLYGSKSFGLPKDIESKFSQYKQKLGGNTCGEVVQTNEVRVIPISSNSDLMLSKLSFLRECRPSVCIPLRGKKRSFGVFILGFENDKLHLQLDLILLKEIGYQIGLAAEKALLFEIVQRSRGRFRQLVDTANAIIFELDVNGQFCQFNQTAEEQTGWARKDLIGQSFDILIEEEQRPKIKALWEKIWAGNVPMNYEFPIQTRRGKSHLIQWSTAEDYDSRGNRIGVVFVGQDITRQREIEQSHKQAEKLAAIGTMISGVAHELNNPLTAVIGYAEILASDPSTDQRIRNELQLIHQQGIRCREVVANLLRFARDERGIRLNIDVSLLLKDCLRLREYHLRIDNIKVESNLGSNLPIIVGDPHQLQTAFLNILTNAQDAMVEQGTEGRLRIQSMAPDPDRVRIEIEDTGGGIENPDRVFEPFFTTKNVGKGTGLGLSVTYGIVVQHEGSITVKNTKEGTLFTIEFPVIDKEMDVEPNWKDQPSLPVFTEVKGKRILVIDDDKTVLKLVSRVLEEKGYEVIKKYSVDAAMEALKKEKFDALVTDLRMPGKWDGIGLYDWLQTEQPELAKRMAFISGDLISKKVRTFLTKCTQPVLAKPFDMGDFLCMVDGLVAQDL